MVTAKVKCTRRDVQPDGQVLLEFQPDYNDGRNKEWAKYTPGLSLTMTVRDESVGQFELNQPYTLQFVPTED